MKMVLKSVCSIVLLLSVSLISAECCKGSWYDDTLSAAQNNCVGDDGSCNDTDMNTDEEEDAEGEEEEDGEEMKDDQTDSGVDVNTNAEALDVDIVNIESGAAADIERGAAADTELGAAASVDEWAPAADIEPGAAADADFIYRPGDPKE